MIKQICWFNFLLICVWTCDKNLVENYQPVDQVVYTTQLKNTEECVDRAIDIKDVVNDTLWKLSQELDIRFILQNIQKINSLYSQLLISCQSIDLLDILNYLELYVNQDGAICLQGIQEVIVILGELRELFEMPITDLVQYLKQLKNISIEKIPLCKNIHFKRKF